MLTEMKLVPHSHLGMPGSIQKHTLVYTVVLGLVLTDRVLTGHGYRHSLGCTAVSAQGYKGQYLGAGHSHYSGSPGAGGFVSVKLHTDPFVIGVAVVTMIVTAVAEQIFLTRSGNARQSKHEGAHDDHHQ